MSHLRALLETRMVRIEVRLGAAVLEVLPATKPEQGFIGLIDGKPVAHSTTKAGVMKVMLERRERRKARAVQRGGK